MLKQILGILVRIFPSFGRKLFSLQRLELEQFSKKIWKKIYFCDWPFLPDIQFLRNQEVC